MNHEDDVTRNLMDSVSTPDYEPIDSLDESVEMSDIPEESEEFEASHLNTDDLPVNQEPVPELPEQSDPVFQDSKCKREECKKAINKGNRFKDTLFALTCFIGGLGGLAMIIICVLITCEAITSNNDKSSVSANPDKVEVYYDENGQIHLNVFVDKKPDININVIVDENGNPSIDAETNPTDETNNQNSNDESEQETTETVTEDVTEPTTETVTEEVTTETDTKVENESEKDVETETENIVNDDDDEKNNGLTDNPDETIEKEPEATITPNDMTKTEYEKYLLDKQKEAVKNGQNRYNDDDTAYKIVRGDTLSQISQRTGYSIQFLAEYNNIQNPNLIITGDLLYIPVS